MSPRLLESKLVCGACVLLAVVVGCGGDDAGGSGGAGGQGTGANGGASGGQGGIGGAVCGNGVVEGSEACDDGGPSATCNADCTASACGDGVVNPAAGELCDDGNAVATDGCDGCQPVPIDLEQGYADGWWPAIAVASVGGQERFLVAYRSGAINDVMAQSYDAAGTPLSGPTLLASGYASGPVDVAASPQGGALVVWQAQGSPVRIQYQRLDPTLAALGAVGQLSTADLRDPRAAAGADGGYCVASFLMSLPVAIRCLPAVGNEIAGVSMPSTFGGIYYEGTHDISAHGDGYLFSYVPDETTQDILSYPLTAQGQADGSGFKAVDFVDPYYSVVSKSAGAPGSTSFVSLGEELGQGALARTIYYQLYAAPSQPLTALSPVSSTPDGTERDGVAVRAGSGRILIVWTDHEVLDSSTNAIEQCVLTGRLFAADGTPLGADVTLYDPGPDLCPTGVRAAADTAGNVMVGWMLAEFGQSTANKQLLALPRLLAP